MKRSMRRRRGQRPHVFLGASPHAWPLVQELHSFSPSSSGHPSPSPLPCGYVAKSHSQQSPPPPCCPSLLGLSGHGGGLSQALSTGVSLGKCGPYLPLLERVGAHSWVSPACGGWGSWDVHLHLHSSNGGSHPLEDEHGVFGLAALHAAINDAALCPAQEPCTLPLVRSRRGR